MPVREGGGPPVHCGAGALTGMDSGAAPAGQHVRYEPDDRPPFPVTVGLGLQYALISVASVVLAPTIMIGIAGGSDAYLSWAVCSALLISGVTTAIQARRIGRIGAGYVLVMGTSSAFLAICVSALERGGPGLLASLIIVAACFQFALAARMSVLRRVFTPTVAGTVLMLIPVDVAPLIIRKLNDVPEGAAAAAAPVVAAVTLLVSAGIALRSFGAWRVWAPALGIVAGCVVGGVGFGVYDTSGIAAASWVGFPAFAYPGLDLSFGPAFWALLPAFVLVTLVGALDTLGDAIAIQRVSWRKPRAIDFRAIQGALNADGVGNLLAGIAGTVPNTTYGNSVAVAELTGITARSVGVCVGVIFAVFAVLPKFVASIIAIPGPAVAAFYLMLVALLFVLGVKIIMQDGLDYRRSLIVGLAFWIGVGFKFGWIFPEYFEGPWNDLLGNGMTVGGCLVVFLNLLAELGRKRRLRLRTALNEDAFGAVDGLLTRLAADRRWDERMVRRLRAVGEETLHVFLHDAANAGGERRLLLIAEGDGSRAELEFIAAMEDTNLEDQMAMLAEGGAGTPSEEELPLRLLRHYASSVRHQQYHDTDVVAVRVDASSARTRPPPD